MKWLIVPCFAMVYAVLLSVPSSVFAGNLANRSALPTTSFAGAIANYGISFDIPTATSLGSIKILVCSNSPLPSESCTAPTGFDSSSTTLVSQSGETGFSIYSQTVNEIIIARAPSTPTVPVHNEYSFNTITNPSAKNSVYYIRLSTHSSTDGTGGVIDSGGIALSTTENINISTYVPPFLEFCAAVTISSNDCSTATGTQLDFGVLSDSLTSTANSQFRAATNAGSGFNVTVLGTTLRSGINEITQNTTAMASTVGVGQFGINLRNNTTPNIGFEATGPGTAGAVGNYGIVDNFTFNSGDLIAQSLLPDEPSTFTVSHIVNIPLGQAVGNYASTLTYVCFGNF